MSDTSLSLVARGIYAALLTYQGRPMNPFDEALEDDDVIADSVAELLGAGLVVRLAR